MMLSALKIFTGREVVIVLLAFQLIFVWLIIKVFSYIVWVYVKVMRKRPLVIMMVLYNESGTGCTSDALNPHASSFCMPLPLLHTRQGELAVEHDSLTAV